MIVAVAPSLATSQHWSIGQTIPLRCVATGRGDGAPPASGASVLRAVGGSRMIGSP
jgi:hypothetical protein